MNIFQEIQSRAIDYKSIINTCHVSMNVGLELYKKSHTDISIIVPVCGRTEFNKVLCDHFLKSKAFVRSLNISLTIVEHSDRPEHRNLCYEQDGVGYIFIPKNGQPFNKSLAHNVGALLTKESEWFLFHDVDTLVPPDFFSKLLLNIRGHNALQTFTKRRLQHCDQWLTDKLVSGEITVAQIESFPGHYQPAQPGAMGGSIMVQKDLFFNTTFCPEIFHGYGLEDAFFWQCIHLIGKLCACDAPENECYHLHHAPAFNRETKPIDWHFYHAFMALPNEEKKRFIQLMASNVNKYRHETENKYS